MFRSVYTADRILTLKGLEVVVECGNLQVSATVTRTMQFLSAISERNFVLTSFTLIFALSFDDPCSIDGRLLLTCTHNKM